jgi:hypothetical protein
VNHRIFSFNIILIDTVIMFGSVAVSRCITEPQWDMTQCSTRQTRYSTAVVVSVKWKEDTWRTPVENHSLHDTYTFTAQSAGFKSTVSIGEFLCLPWKFLNSILSIFKTFTQFLWESIGFKLCHFHVYLIVNRMHISVLNVCHVLKELVSLKNVVIIVKCKSQISP